jgi:hypothetical protein
MPLCARASRAVAAATHLSERGIPHPIDFEVACRDRPLKAAQLFSAFLNFCIDYPFLNGNMQILRTQEGHGPMEFETPTSIKLRLDRSEIRLIAEALNHRAQEHEANIHYGMWDTGATPLKEAARKCRELSGKLMASI